jgi:hypothetical protein
MHFKMTRIESGVTVLKGLFTLHMNVKNKIVLKFFSCHNTVRNTEFRASFFCHFKKLRCKSLFIVNVTFKRQILKFTFRSRQSHDPWCKEAIHFINVIGERLIAESGDSKSKKFL